MEGMQLFDCKIVKGVIYLAKVHLSDKDHDKSLRKSEVNGGLSIIERLSMIGTKP